MVWQTRVNYEKFSDKIFDTLETLESILPMNDMTFLEWISEGHIKGLLTDKEWEAIHFIQTY